MIKAGTKVKLIPSLDDGTKYIVISAQDAKKRFVWYDDVIRQHRPTKGNRRVWLEVVDCEKDCDTIGRIGRALESSLIVIQ